MHRITPNRSFRRSKPTRRKPSTIGFIFALQLAFFVAIAQMKLMPNYIGKCGMGHDMYQCETCRGPGQCQSDPTCNDGIRCTGGCTNL